MQRETQRKTRTVCVVGHSAAMHGAERSLLELTDAIERTGRRCVVLLPRRGPLLRELRNRGITCIYLPFTWWMSSNPSYGRRWAKLALNLAMALPMATVLKLWRCRVVYSNTLATPAGAFAAAIAGVPHVWHVREFFRGEHGLVLDFGADFSMRVVERLSILCVATSESLAEAVRSYLPPERVVVVPQAVERPEAGYMAAPVPAGPFRFVIAGALSEAKGHKDAIRALAIVNGREPAAQLLIAGDGRAEDWERLRALSQQVNVGDAVQFTGHVMSIYPLLASAHATLICSHNEGFGRVAVESMLANRPVIGAASGATIELIHHGVTGLLYDPGKPDDLAEQMKVLMNDASAAATLAANARRWAEDVFCDASYRDRVAALLDRALYNGMTRPSRV